MLKEKPVLNNTVARGTPKPDVIIWIKVFPFKHHLFVKPHSFVTYKIPSVLYLWHHILSAKIYWYQKFSIPDKVLKVKINIKHPAVNSYSKYIKGQGKIQLLFKQYLMNFK